jgi:AcrR family transcriptional regulator
VRLNREQVLTAALDLLDEVGLDQLTMRRLTTALGVQNGATYWHFRSKQALLEAMADELLAGVVEGVTGPWDVRVIDLARRLRRALLSRRHRDLSRCGPYDRAAAGVDSRGTRATDRRRRRRSVSAPGSGHRVRTGPASR